MTVSARSRAWGAGRRRRHAGPVSLPFRAGRERHIAVKAIDFRGNGAIRVVELPG